MKRLLALATFVAALGFLPALFARAVVVDDLKINNTNGVFVPDAIYAGQPFSFAAAQIGSVQGEVISVETADGVVVQRAAADKYGRVFLAAGLPAGAYLISRSSYGQPFGKIEIKQRAADALDHTLHPLQLQNPPETLKLSDPFSLSGHGFSPNFSDMKVSLAASGKTEAPIVLAATEDQLKLAPVQQLQPGAAMLRVTNQATEQSTNSYDLLLYDIQGELRRRKLHSGNDQTQLLITTSPGNVPFKVRASVISGPVDFGAGRREAEAVTRDGKAIFPVHAEKGAGPFQLTWELVAPAATVRADADQPVRADGHKDRVPELGPPDVPQPPDFPSAPPHQDHGDCHCHVSAGGGIAELEAKVGARPAPGQIDVDSAFDNQQQRDDWRKQRKDRPVFQAYVGTVELTFRINATTVQAQGTDAGEMQIHRTTRVKVSLGSAWDFQVFRKGNTGFLPIDGRTENEALHCPNGTVTFKEISGEYRIELWRKSQTDPIPDKTSMDVDVSVVVDPCGHEAHEKATYWLGFAKTGEVKMLHSVERMP